MRVLRGQCVVVVMRRKSGLGLRNCSFGGSIGWRGAAACSRVEGVVSWPFVSQRRTALGAPAVHPMNHAKEGR